MAKKRKKDRGARDDGPRVDDSLYGVWGAGVYSTADYEASERRDAERRETWVYPPSTSRADVWRCVTCRGEWTERGSSERGYCTRCGTERPK